MSKFHLSNPENLLKVGCKTKKYHHTTAWMAKTKEEKVLETFERFLRGVSTIHEGERIIWRTQGKSNSKVKLGTFVGVGKQVVSGSLKPVPTVFVCNSDILNRGFYAKSDALNHVHKAVLGFDRKQRGERGKGRDYDRKAIAKILLDKLY